MDNICIRIKKSIGGVFYADCRNFAPSQYIRKMKWSSVDAQIVEKNKSDFIKEIGQVFKLLTVKIFDLPAARGTASTLEIMNMCEEASGTDDKFDITLFARNTGKEAWDAFDKANDTEKAQLKAAKITFSMVQLDDKTKKITLIVTFQVPVQNKR